MKDIGNSIPELLDRHEPGSIRAYSIGIRVPDEYLIERTLREEPTYLALSKAMTRLRGLVWDEDDEARLCAIEARMFRLLSFLDQINRELGNPGL